MPLGTTEQGRLKAAVTSALPPAVYGSVTGYVASGKSLAKTDDLGLLERDALFYLTSGTVTPGDQLGSNWIVWEPFPGETYPTYALRRLLPFVGWTRTRRSVTGRTEDTDEPIYTTSTATVQLYLAALKGAIDDGQGGYQRGVTATFIAHGAFLLALKDQLSLNGERYTVVSVKPYGPWQRAEARSA